MSDRLNSDEMKGRIKQAAGDLTDNEELAAESEADEAAGKAKKFVDGIAERAHDAIDSLGDRVRGQDDT